MPADEDRLLENLKRAARAYHGSVKSLPEVRQRLLDDLGRAAEAWAALERTRRSGAFRLNLPAHEDDDE